MRAVNLLSMQCAIKIKISGGFRCSQDLGSILSTSRKIGKKTLLSKLAHNQLPTQLKF